MLGCEPAAQGVSSSRRVRAQGLRSCAHPPRAQSGVRGLGPCSASVTRTVRCTPWGLASKSRSATSPPSTSTRSSTRPTPRCSAGAASTARSTAPRAPTCSTRAARLNGCAFGDAKATPGFELPARFVIHTVGPIWDGGDHGEARLLASCYRRCLEVADELGAASVAFPAISTGAYRLPGRARPPGSRSPPCGPRSRSVELVRFVCFDAAVHERYLPRARHAELPARSTALRSAGATADARGGGRGSRRARSRRGVSALVKNARPPLSCVMRSTKSRR